MAELLAEIDRAMSGPPTGDGWSCFVSNKALIALSDHGPELSPAIEEAVRRFRFEGAPWFGEGNLFHLLLIYFEKADDGSEFVRSLGGRHLDLALRAMFQIWGPTRGPARRRVISQPLYDAWRELFNGSGLQGEGTEDWLARYVADGSLRVAAARPSAQPADAVDRAGG